MRILRHKIYLMDEDRDEYKPLFHSRGMVIVFTFFLGAFFGSLLFSQNLREAGKRNFIAATIISALLYNYFALRLLTKLGINNTALSLFAGNTVAALIIGGLYWHYYFKNIPLYNRRSIWGPLLAIVLIYGFFIIMNIIFPGRIGQTN
jgi:hypothetical protein